MNTPKLSKRTRGVVEREGLRFAERIRFAEARVGRTSEAA